MEAAIKKILKLDKTNWTPIKFGEVVFESKDNAKDIYNEGIEHVVGLEHIDSENMHLTRSGKLEETTTFSKQFRKGDVLFGRRRAYLKKAALASFDGICSGDITVFRTKKNLLPELLPFIVNNEKFFDYAIKHSAGGLSPRVKFRDLANYEFLLPSKHQQAQLAELLWTMDEVIESEISLLKNAEIIWEVSQQEYLLGKFLESPRKSTKIGNIPVDWNLIELTKIAWFQEGPGLRDWQFTEEGIKVINVTNLVGGVLDLSKTQRHVSWEEFNTSYKHFECRVGDIVVASSGNSYCKHAIIREKDLPLMMNTSVIRFQPLEGVNFNFLNQFLKSKIFKHQIDILITGAAQPNFGPYHLNQILVPFPNTLEEQELIGAILSLVDKNILEINSKIESSKALQKSLINQIF